MVPSSQSSTAGVIHFKMYLIRMLFLHNLYMTIYNKHTQAQTYPKEKKKMISYSKCQKGIGSEWHFKINR